MPRRPRHVAPADRTRTTVLGLVAATALVAAACRAALSWDGSYYLFATLDRQAPFVAHGRLVVGVMEWPVVLLSRVVEDLDVLAVAFSLLFALVPLVSLASSWALSRTRPELFVWAVLAVCLGTLPGQLFLVSEAVISVQLFWPVLVWIAAGAPRRHVWLAALLAVGTLLAHPFAAPLMALGAGLLLLRARRSQLPPTWTVPRRGRTADQRRWRRGIAVALAAISAGRLLLVGGSGYEERSINPEIVLDHFLDAVAGLPLTALAAGWTAGALLIAADRLRPDRRRLALRVAAGLAAVAAVALLVWAAHPSRWQAALGFRTWALFTTVPFVALLAVDALQAAPGDARSAGTTASRPRRIASAAAAGVFAVVLVTQSALFAGTLRQLEAEVAVAPGCLEELELSLGGTALNHWGRRSASLLVQGRTPRTLVLPRDQCATVDTAEEFNLAPFEARDRDRGWFTLPQPPPR